MANMLTTAGCDHVITIDLHASQIQVSARTIFICLFNNFLILMFLGFLRYSC